MRCLFAFIYYSKERKLWLVNQESVLHEFAFVNDIFVHLKAAHMPASYDLFSLPIVLLNLRELKTHLGGWGVTASGYRVSFWVMKMYQGVVRVAQLCEHTKPLNL